MLKAAALITYMVISDLVMDADRVNKEYGNKTRGQPGNKLGPPHFHTWRVFLRTLEAASLTKIANAENPPATQALALPKNYLEQYEKTDVASACMTISIFRFKITREKDKAIISFTLSQLMPPLERQALQHALHILILLTGGDVRAGPPPALQAERNLQTAIDGLKKDAEA